MYKQLSFRTINPEEIFFCPGHCFEGGENFSQREFSGWELRVEGQTWGIVKTHYDAYLLLANVYSLLANAYSLN